MSPTRENVRTAYFGLLFLLAVAGVYIGAVKSDPQMIVCQRSTTRLGGNLHGLCQMLRLLSTGCGICLRDVLVY